MKILLGVVLLSTTVEAETPKVFVCHAECLSVNVNARSVEFLGTLTTSGKHRLEAWKKLAKRCEKSVRGYFGAPLLTEGPVFLEIDQSYGSSSWYESSLSRTSTFYYSSLSVSNAGKKSFHQDDKFILQVTPARPATSCNLEEVSEEELIEYYEGDLPVFG